MPIRYLGQNFCPYQNIALAATASSQNSVFTQPTSGLTARDLYIANTTAVTAFVSWGTTAQTANTSTSFAVPAGAIMTIDTDIAVTNVAVILASSTGNVYLSIGTGT